MKFKVSLYVCKLHQYIELSDNSET